MTKANSSVSRVWHKYVRGVGVDPWLRYPTLDAARNSLFLGQGELDRACGLYCVTMAVMLVCGLPRRLAKSALNADAAPYRAFKTIAKDMYFSGSHGETLGLLAKGLKSDASYTVTSGTHRVVLDSVLRAVGKGVPAILAVHDRQLRYCHWVLVVGIEYTGDRLSEKVPIALLGLDPSGKPELLRYFNWRLELTTANRRSPYLRCHDDRRMSTQVTCVECVVVSSRSGANPSRA